MPKTIQISYDTTLSLSIWLLLLPYPPSPQTIHISQSVFEQILPLVPEENKADVCAVQYLLSPS